MSWLTVQQEFPACAAGGGAAATGASHDGSAPARCSDAYGNHLLLWAFKNKVDYYRVYGLHMFYKVMFLYTEMSGF